MRFFRRACASTTRLAIFPGTFNPPTIAHEAMAMAAIPLVDEVLYVLPEAFPHKEYDTGAGFEDRIHLLLRMAEDTPCSVASTQGGLFIDIARECRMAYGAATQLYFLCGRDAAERIVMWDYGEPGAFARMLGEFELLVAGRDGVYEAPAEFRSRIHNLNLDRDYSGCSASQVRARIARKEPWEHLVPAAIRDEVRRIYS